MKLSEAILLGSVGTEQAYGVQSIYENNRGRCALGAALYAIGKQSKFGEQGSRPYGVIEDMWPWTKTSWSICADCSENHPWITTILDHIWHLNDHHKWPRPQIAAWVAELEKQYDPDPQPLQKEDCHELSTMPGLVSDRNVL